MPSDMGSAIRRERHRIIPRAVRDASIEQPGAGRVAARVAIPHDQPTTNLT